jgi:parallel beta-helix repeat protein
MFSKMLAAALIGLGVSASAAQAQVVTSTANAGPGTLRSAINQANANANRSFIQFNLPAAGMTITPTANLPALTQPVEIDASMQPGVVIDAVNVAQALGLNTNDSVIRGLTIHDSSGAAAAVGIQVNGSRNHLEYNQIGTDAAGGNLGNMWNLTTGVAITGNQNVVKGGVISESSGDGLAINGNQNIVVAARLGLPYNGGVGNSGSGVAVTGDENQIGGMDTGHRNVISENNDHGAEIAGNHNRVEGNYVGLDETGATGPGNVNDGIHVAGNENLVRGNVSSNNDAGVLVDGTSNTIMGNTLGTDATQAVAQSNRDGVLVAGGFTNLVGGDEANFIAGNTESGVQIEGGQNHRVEGNDLGTAALPNDDGVLVEDSFNVVSGNTASGNRDAGIKIEGGAAGPPPVNNVIEDNDSSGNEQGVVIEDAHLNAVTGNTVTGNLDEGVLIEAFNRPNADGNWLTGNTIEDNGLSGVRIEDGADNSVGIPDRDVNVITGNGGDGVTVDPGGRNAIVNNSIYANDDLGIDLDDDGQTANDGLLDPDTGANGLQNHPIIDSHTLVFVGTFPDLVPKNLIGWTLRTAAATDYRLEFYVNDTCGGRGEAKELLATRQVTTDGTGLAQGSITVDPVDEKVTVTATETDPNGFVLGPTSELSACG